MPEGGPQGLISNPLVPPYLWPKIFKCLESRFYQLKVVGFKFRNSFLIIWKRLEIVTTHFWKKSISKGGPQGLILNPLFPLTYDRKFSNALKAVFISWKWLVLVQKLLFDHLKTSRDSYNTRLKKIDTKGGTIGPDFKSFGHPLPLTSKFFKCLDSRFYQHESDWFKFRNSFLIIWKRLGIVTTTFEKKSIPKGGPQGLISNPLAPPYLWPKIFKCIESRFYQLKVIALSSETPFWLFENVWGSLQTLLKKIDTIGGTIGPDLKSFSPPYRWPLYFQMPW